VNFVCGWGGFNLTITAWDRARGTSVRVLSQEDEETVTNSVTLRSANRPERIEVLGEYQNLRGPGYCGACPGG
jgi:hypothetical protein